MLRKIKVEGFRNFDKEFSIDFTDTKHYTWNQNHIRDGIVKNAILYGLSGSGKSNLGKVILDAKENAGYISPTKTNNFLNVTKNEANFYFEFQYYNDSVLKYNYKKSSKNYILYESLKIDEDFIFEHNYETQDVLLGEQALKTLNLSGLSNDKATLSFIRNNSNLSIHHPINYLYNFLNNTIVLTTHLNLKSLHQLIDIFTKDELTEYNFDLKKFFNEMSFDEYPRYNINKKEFEMKFSNGRVVDFNSCASNGQIGLLYFYTLKVYLKESIFSKDKYFENTKVKVLDREYEVDREVTGLFYYDEFDAFYDNVLSKQILETVFKSQYQTLLTTHNTNLISNSISRPDCYFEIDKNQIKNLSSRTKKELRRGHALEKMFLSGAFKFNEDK